MISLAKGKKPTTDK